MKTVTFKVSDELDQRLAALAEKTGESKSNLIRTAIEYVLTMRGNVAPDSCLDLARDLGGAVEGPADLSYSKKHLEGYGFFIHTP